MAFNFITLREQDLEDLQRQIDQQGIDVYGDVVELVLRCVERQRQENYVNDESEVDPEAE